MATYSDDFNRADSTSLGNWTEHALDWSITSNRLAPVSGVTGVALYGSPLSTSDHYSEIVMSTVATASMGVVARSDASALSFYLWRNNGTSWVLFSNVSGTFTSIGNSYAAAAVNGDVARIECIGSTIKGYVNGILRSTATNSAITTGLYAGVRSDPTTTLRYDNFQASDISTATNTGAFLEFMQA